MASTAAAPLARSIAPTMEVNVAAQPLHKQRRSRTQSGAAAATAAQPLHTSSGAAAHGAAQPLNRSGAATKFTAARPRHIDT